jgi:hypothetical protein
VLASRWSAAVGPQLSEITSFRNARYIGKDKLFVTANMLGAAAIMVKCQSDKIVQGIHRLTGVNDVELIFKHVTSIARDPDAARDNHNLRLDIQVCKIDEPFENETLKRALELLKTEIQNAA